MPAFPSLFAVFWRSSGKSALIDRSGARTYNPRCFSGDLFSHPTIREAPDALPEWHLLIRDVLVPLLVVEYERFRFVEPHSSTRISLNTGISCSQANSMFLAGTAPVRLDVGVLDRLPGFLKPQLVCFEFSASAYKLTSRERNFLWHK